MEKEKSIKREEAMKIYTQEQNSWCGVACVKMILDFYGIRYSQRRIAREMGTTKDGTTPIQIKHYLRSLDIKTWESRGLTYDKLVRLVKNNEEQPMLIHWWDGRIPPADGHYSLIYKINKKHIILADPATGLPFLMKKDNFISVWKDGEKDKPSGWVMIC